MKKAIHSLHFSRLRWKRILTVKRHTIAL